MSNSISRRTFLKCTGASVAALGAASLLGGCQQNGSATIVDVKVGDKISNWNGLGVMLTPEASASVSGWALVMVVGVARSHCSSLIIDS